MAQLPEATVIIDDEAGALASGVDYLTILACVATSADTTPRVFTSTKSLLEKHGYSQGVDYAALHFQETGKPVIFVGLPKTTAGTIYQQDDSGVDGSSTITLAAGANGVVETLHGILTVTKGGTIGTDQIEFTLSLDGGRTEKTIRLGTAASYTVPYVGVVLNFGAGTLDVDDVFTFRTTAPRWAQADIEAARLALAAQQKQARSWLVVGDLLVEQDATDIVTEVNAYETANDRFVYARAQARDRHPDAKLTGAPEITFAENSPAADTLTRAAGSWITDGFKAGMAITVAGTTSNNGTFTIASLTATVITLDAGDDLTAETDSALTITGEELAADWRTDIDAEFADIDDEKRLDIGAGYARKRSIITGWLFRRPVAWAASIREYQHDVQIPTWRKADGSVDGWDLEDDDGNLVEHDERVDGGLLAARFTCFRSYANGPAGAFVALSLTRALEGSLLSRTHNMAVANVACTIAQAETENAIGQVLELTEAGTGTEESLTTIEERVNSALAIALLQRRSEGPRASAARWTASRQDVLNVPGAELTGTLNLLLNGTLEKITTRVRVQTAG